MMNYAGQCFELEQWFQPFGREATFLEHLRSLAEPWVDECWIDDYGSLIAHQRGDGKFSYDGQRKLSCHKGKCGSLCKAVGWCGRI